MKNWMKDATVPLLALMLLGILLSTEAAIDKGSIVGIWLFDEGSGNKAKDSSDNGNHGNLVNKPEWDNDGKFGKALSFETAKSSYVLVPPISFQFNNCGCLGQVYSSANCQYRAVPRAGFRGSRRRSEYQDCWYLG